MPAPPFSSRASTSPPSPSPRLLPVLPSPRCFLRPLRPPAILKPAPRRREKSLDDYLESYPVDTAALRDLMEIKIKAGKLPEALAIVDRLIVLEPGENDLPILKAHIQSYVQWEQRRDGEVGFRGAPPRGPVARGGLPWMDVACFQLDGNADAVEFCPHYPFQQILAAATYTLQEGGQPDRSGSISLFSVEDDVGVELIHRVETVGIFDIKWNPYGTNADPLLALADAHGCLSVHSLKPSQDPETHGAILGEVCKEKVSPSMCLCLDWNPSATRISVGLSDGSMSVVSIGDAKFQISESWEAHGYEVWAASFDTHQPQLLYTGSDDCCFSCWDLRESPAKPVFQNTKSHKMGVCCIAKSPSNSNMLLTGSYDEFLRVWDVRATSRPLNESSICVGGGVWRIKHHPDIPGLVLAACMHNGFAVVKITEEGITVVEKYQKHESLAYGADWKKGGLFKTDGTRRGSLVATCSFYDKLLRIWLPESLLLG